MRRRIILVLTVMALVLVSAMPAVAQQSKNREIVRETTTTTTSGPSCNINGTTVEDPEVCRQAAEEALQYAGEVLGALFG